MFYTTKFHWSRPPANRGFTLIELMIAFAIIAVLISLAVPYYSGNRIRAKVTGCITNTTPAKPVPAISHGNLIKGTAQPVKRYPKKSLIYPQVAAMTEFSKQIFNVKHVDMVDYFYKTRYFT